MNANRIRAMKVRPSVTAATRSAVNHTRLIATVHAPRLEIAVQTAMSIKTERKRNSDPEPQGRMRRPRKQPASGAAA